MLRIFGFRSSKQISKKRVSKGYGRRIKKAAAGVTAVTLGLLGYSEFIGTEIELIYRDTKFNNFVISQIEELHQKYKNTFYLPFPILELFFGSSVQKPPSVPVIHEKVQLEDGDTLDLGKIRDLFCLEWVFNEDFNGNNRQKIALVLSCINGANGDFYSR